jgi:hypothetical protein
MSSEATRFDCDNNVPRAHLSLEGFNINSRNWKLSVIDGERNLNRSLAQAKGQSMCRSLEVERFPWQTTYT